MYEFIGKLMMLSMPLPPIRRLYKSNPRDFGKSAVLLYGVSIAGMVVNFGLMAVIAKVIRKSDPNVEETPEEHADRLRDIMDNDLIAGNMLDGTAIYFKLNDKKVVGRIVSRYYNQGPEGSATIVQVRDALDEIHELKWNTPVWYVD